MLAKPIKLLHVDGDLVVLDKPCSLPVSTTHCVNRKMVDMKNFCWYEKNRMVYLNSSNFLKHWIRWFFILLVCCYQKILNRFVTKGTIKLVCTHNLQNNFFHMKCMLVAHIVHKNNQCGKKLKTSAMMLCTSRYHNLVHLLPTKIFFTFILTYFHSLVSSMLPNLYQ